MDEGAGAHAPTTTCSLSTSEADFESDIEFPDDEEPLRPLLILLLRNLNMTDPRLIFTERYTSSALLPG